MNQRPEEQVSHLKVWVLSDGKAGHEAQSLGIAEALGVKDISRVYLRKGLKNKLISFFDPAALVEGLPDGIPDILIGTGWHTVKVSHWLKSVFPHVFQVQIMQAAGTESFGAVVALAHDRPRLYENVIEVASAPNRLNMAEIREKSAALKQHLAECAPHLAETERYLAVLIGGSSKKFNFGVDEARQFAREVVAFAREQKAGLVVTTSRRTGAEATGAAHDVFESSGVPLFFWDAANNDGDNPYPALLGLASAAVVTAESVSMVSEACTAGLPVYVWGIDEMNKTKFKHFYAPLVGQKRVAPLEGDVLEMPEQPLSDTQKAAGFVRGRLLQHLYRLQEGK